MTPRKVDLTASFVRKILAKANAAKNFSDPRSYAASRWGNYAPEWNLRVAVPGSGSVDGAFQSEVSAFFKSVIEGSVPGRMTGIRRVPFNARLVHITPTGGASASWVAEGEGKPLSSVALSAQPLRAKKVVAMAVFSDELLSAAGDAGEAVVRNDLSRAVSNSISSAFLDGAGDDATPASITDGVVAVTAGENVGGSLGALFDDFSGSLERSVFIARPEVFGSLSGANFPQVGLRGGMLLGSPSIASRFAPANRLILADPSLIAMAGGETEIRISSNAAIQCDDDPSQSAFTGSPSAPVASNLVSLFQVNAQAMLCEVAVNWFAPSGSVSMLDTTAWSGTSP